MRKSLHQALAGIEIVPKALSEVKIIIVRKLGKSVRKVQISISLEHGHRNGEHNISELNPELHKKYRYALFVN